MGQQQLLLVILVVIIVGITTIVAVNVLEVGANNSNQDAVRQDLLKAVSHAQEIWEKPVILGGAGKDFANNMTEPEILIALNIPGEFDNPQNPTKLVNDNGEYSVINPTKSSLTINGIVSADGSTIQSIICRDSLAQVWKIDVDSPTASNPC